MRTPLASTIPLVLIAALSGCQTVIVESQRDPGPIPAFEKTLVVVSAPANARRVGEDQIVARLPALHPSQSYHLMPSSRINFEEVKTQAKGDGFDGLILLWVDDKSVYYTPTVGDEVTIQGTRIVTTRLNARVFSLKDGREVWRGLIRRRDSDPLVQSMPAIARVLAKDLRAQGLAD